MVSYSDGWQIQEGDAVLWTIPEGTSYDGNGYVNEKFILLDRRFSRDGIYQRYWRVRINIDYMGEPTVGGFVRDTTGRPIFDTRGTEIRDTRFGGP